MVNRELFNRLHLEMLLDMLIVDDVSPIPPYAFHMSYQDAVTVRKCFSQTWPRGNYQLHIVLLEGALQSSGLHAFKEDLCSF